MTKPAPKVNKIEFTKITYRCRKCNQDVKIFYEDLKTGRQRCEKCFFEGV